MIDANSVTAKAVLAWAEKGLQECRTALEKKDTTWDAVVGLRREIRRLTHLVQFVTNVEMDE